MKFLTFLGENILLILTLILLVVIPLYPKLPLIDIKNTWVYIRWDDFLVLFAIFIYFIQVVRNKATLKTPLTLSILVFWIIGAVATIHAVIIIFPEIANVFTNVAFLSFIRRIEYMSLFFIAYSGMRRTRNLAYVIVALVATFLVVVGYGIGQRYLEFPAFLTMNEEYAKGLAIYLSRLSRVPSTFGGHYDLAAYLVLVIPIFMSFVFALRSWFVKLFFLGTVALGVILLFMTVSRVSFFALLVSLATLVFLYGRKTLLTRRNILLFAIALLLGTAIFSSSRFSRSLLARFGNTVGHVDILVDAKTGADIGQVKKVSSKSFRDKLVIATRFGNKTDLSMRDKNPELASESAIVLFKQIPREVIEVVPSDTPTGENLPQGTGYINLPLSPVTKRLSNFFYEFPSQGASLSAYISRFDGDFLIKRAGAYDLSFTTRFQGEWPRALEAFKRNILFGSGYSSVSLAVDNDFLRTLAEIGLLGFASFFAIFALAGIYMRTTLPDVPSPLARSFILGLGAGLAGLMINALLIDVFEASKVAYTMWLLIGVGIGLLHLYQKRNFSLAKELLRTLTSDVAIVIYLSLTAFIIFSPMINNYFVGDDFTWLRWAADCSVFSHSTICPSFLGKIIHYFTQSDGFFYRPGTKTYFLLMYSLFWLNQEAYHIVSLALHGIITVLIFLLTKKITRDKFMATLTSFLFLISSGHLEAVFWISATGHLFNEMFILLSLLFFIAWDEHKKAVYFVLSFASFVLSLLFYELGIVIPFLVIAYKYVTEGRLRFDKIVRERAFVAFFIPVAVYFGARFVAGSHWFNGDYNYNLLKLPLNSIGNAVGYIFLSVVGTSSLSVYEIARNASRTHLLFSGGVTIASVAVLILALLLYKLKLRKVTHVVNELASAVGREDKKIVVWGALFFVITLIPFLGLGNITSRYSYLSSAGILLLFALFLKKLYSRLLKNGRDIALASLATAISVFCLFHIIQIQQIYGNWFDAGDMVRRFFISIDGVYEDHWSRERMEFHFVNVPTRVGEAWVFPVGLKDALWFSFQNPNTSVFQDSSLENALNAAGYSSNKVVLEFDQSGRVTLVRRVATVQGVMIQRIQ